MEEGTKLNIKLEKYVVLQGKLSVYHTEGFLGEGSYGKVVKCTKLDNEELVAVKVLRKDCFKEGKKEAKILRKILQLDPEKNNLLKFIESFKYKGYFCLAFEILDVSVFDFIKSRDFVPLSLPEIRVIAQQLLVALNALKSAGLVHADIKPDNIMFVNHRSQPLKVKLIDFGLAVKASKLWFVGTVQAIGYRAPEVILGLKMNESVDMWSLGCSLAYMYLGYNLYPTHCVYEVIRAIVHIHGQPPDDVLKDGMDVQHFFTKLTDSSHCTFRLNTPAEYTNATGYGTQFKSGIYNRISGLDDLLKTRPRPIDPMEREDSLGFISLLKQILLVDPDARITPGEALGHCFITMKSFSGGRNNSSEASTSKMVTDCKIHEFAVDHYVMSSEEAGRTMEDAAERLPDKEQPRRALMKVSSCLKAQQEGVDQTDTAADGRNKEPSVQMINLFPDKEQMGKTIIKVRPYIFAYQESAETIVKTSGKSKFIPPAFGYRSGQKGSESKASGKPLKDIEWKERTIIKVKPYSSADQGGKDRADKKDVSSEKAGSTDTKTPKKCSAAERKGIFCINRNPSDFVEVKARKTSAMKTRNFFSWLIKFISCNRKCD
ncbi:homeodomain-interacting protein kinase 3-like isoform X1 [Poecilia formosa]|uniref:homeodomain-interacting protein kinase 3-like isoform X1 n=1 Tax=Poecilia formosa TaxID=48698 RepID=UPI0007BA1588|nr:PREDICTED: homeodomain-interacting protein kinase 3-like isoform X1 [Poecilia formosa]XP_016529505.1 PREDICTED: homeodomain-interacting protein kinase 3-like isoform X1 [Poecilia formosa]